MTLYNECMNIESLSTDMSQGNVQQQASVSLLKSSMDMMKSSGADMVQMINNSEPAPLPESTGAKVDLFA